MRRRLLVVLVLMVAVPLALLVWLGERLTAGEAAAMQTEMDSLFEARLSDLDATVGRLLEARRRELEKLTAVPSVTPSELRERSERAPIVAQLFAQDETGALRYPVLDGPLTAGERAFLTRTRHLWGQQGALARPGESNGKTSSQSWGWYSWYWENGLHLLYWRRSQGGGTIGAELNHARLLADVIAELPASGDAHAVAEERVALVDPEGATLYQWGPYTPPDDVKPRLVHPLAPPLGAWKLAVYTPPTSVGALGGRASLLGLLAGLVGLALGLGALSYYFYRESDRELRGAAQRVSFVNQVSHELKTPLTNIRMYAEMLEGRLDGEDERAQRYMDVIVAESQRLSRLIGNVLTFARQQRHALKPRLVPAVVDAIVDEVLTDFAPSLAQKEIAIRFERGAGRAVMVDRDAVAQIIYNLVNNVEKYAAAGKLLAIKTELSGSSCTMVVEDAGSGIPPAQAEAVFRPFYRLQNAVTEGAAGTGIGLGLARDLARMLGGDVAVLPCDRGARLRVTLHAPPAEDASGSRADSGSRGDGRGARRSGGGDGSSADLGRDARDGGAGHRGGGA